MSSNKHIDLMRLHDGELSDAEAMELERELSESERKVLAGLEDLGERIRLANAQAPIDLADDIMSRLDEAHGDSAAPPPAPVRELRPRRPAATIVVSVAIAAAAAVAVWFTARSEDPQVAPTAAQKPVPAVTVPEALSVPPHATEAVAELEDEEVAAPAAAIESVDFGNANGTIFMVPSGDETTPVVWLPDEGPNAGRETL
jgi:hypothetical protein